MGGLYLNHWLDALVPHKSDAVGQFIEDRVLRAREVAEENAEPSVWPTSARTQANLGTPTRATRIC